MRSRSYSSIEAPRAALERGLDVLFAFTAAQPALTAAEIAAGIGLPVSTTYRYLRVLLSHGLLQRADTSLYRLGLRCLELARVASAQLDLLAAARPVMQDLHRRTGETVMLAAMRWPEIVCLDRIESTHAMRISFDIGHTLPLHAGSTAKVLLAFADPAQQEAILTLRLQAFTPHTITDPARLRRELELIRVRGYATSRGEVDEGARGISALVRGAGDRVAAALTVAGPKSRLSGSRVMEAIAAVRAAAAEITAQLTGSSLSAHTRSETGQKEGA